MFIGRPFRDARRDPRTLMYVRERRICIAPGLGVILLMLSSTGCRPAPVPGIAAGDGAVPRPWVIHQPGPDLYSQDPTALEATLRAAGVAARMDTWPQHDPPIAYGLIQFRPVELVPTRKGASHELAVETAIQLGESPGTSRRLWIRCVLRDRPESWRGPFVVTVDGEAVLTGR